MEENIIDTVSGSGFLKVTRPERPNLTGSQKSALIRRGNEFFNAGRIEDARKIFLTTGYSDGLVRVGDKYLEQHQTLEAFRMYCLAPDIRKKEMLIERFASVIRGWVGENTPGSTITKEGIDNNGRQDAE